jgi:hypothetical protein
MDLKQIEVFRRKYGRTADKTLEVLAKLCKDIESVFDLDIGVQILTEDLLRYDSLLFKAASQVLSDDERAEFRYLYRRLESLSAKINKYYELISKIEV